MIKCKNCGEKMINREIVTYGLLTLWWQEIVVSLLVASAVLLDKPLIVFLALTIFLFKAKVLVIKDFHKT